MKPIGSQPSVRQNKVAHLSNLCDLFLNSELVILKVKCCFLCKASTNTLSAPKIALKGGDCNKGVPCFKYLTEVMYSIFGERQ